MTDKPKRGRPLGARRTAQFTIQKHIFLDQDTTAMLREMAEGNESAFVRELLRREYKQRMRIIHAP